MKLYDCEVEDMQGKTRKLSEYEGKVLLIVNTATGCGFTPQYDGLQDLYEKYKDKGFEILDFPCNQFGNQAPGSDEEIVSFCSSRYGITFPQFAKIEVNGENELPLYGYLKQEKGGTAYTCRYAEKQGLRVINLATYLAAKSQNNKDTK